MSRRSAATVFAIFGTPCHREFLVRSARKLTARSKRSRAWLTSLLEFACNSSLTLTQMDSDYAALRGWVMLLQATSGVPRSAHVIVLGNEKGGSGKSTTAMHIAVALLKAGQRVATIDLDSRQKTFTHYVENRRDSAQRVGVGARSAGPLRHRALATARASTRTRRPSSRASRPRSTRSSTATISWWSIRPATTPT